MLLCSDCSIRVFGTDTCFIRLVQQSFYFSKQIQLMDLFCDSAGTQVQGPTVLTMFKNIFTWL